MFSVGFSSNDAKTTYEFIEAGDRLTRNLTTAALLKLNVKPNELQRCFDFIKKGDEKQSTSIVLTLLEKGVVIANLQDCLNYVSENMLEHLNILYKLLDAGHTSSEMLNCINKIKNTEQGFKRTNEIELMNLGVKSGNTKAYIDKIIAFKVEEKDIE